MQGSLPSCTTLRHYFSLPGCLQDKKDYVLKRVRLAKQTKWQRNSTLQERDLVSPLCRRELQPADASTAVAALLQSHSLTMQSFAAQQSIEQSFLMPLLPQQQVLHCNGMQVSTLQHPFIVPCVESWMVQGHTVNMIYGYCEKGDLSSYLQRVQRMVSKRKALLVTKAPEAACNVTAHKPCRVEKLADAAQARSACRNGVC